MGFNKTEDNPTTGEMVTSLMGAAVLVFLALWFGANVVRNFTDPPQETLPGITTEARVFNALGDDDQNALCMMYTENGRLEFVDIIVTNDTDTPEGAVRMANHLEKVC